jgi:dipeptidase E
VLPDGVVLCGISAGMNCWFAESVTDSFDLNRLTALHDGLGLLAGSCCPHYDGEQQRRPTFHRLIAEGELTSGLAADDGAALVFIGTELDEVVSSRPAAGAYRVEQAGTATAEHRLPVRYLGCSE